MAKPIVDVIIQPVCLRFRLHEDEAGLFFCVFGGTAARPHGSDAGRRSRRTTDFQDERGFPSGCLDSLDSRAKKLCSSIPAIIT